MILAWSLNATYIVCIVVGLGYMASSFLLGHVGGQDAEHGDIDHGDIGHGDIGHGDVGHGVVDAVLGGGHGLHDIEAHEQHGEADQAALQAHGGAHGEGAYVGPWSPMILATFVFFFGCTGYLFNIEAIAEWGRLSLLPAGGSGFFFAALAIYAINKIFVKTEGTSEPGTRELVGKQATVITPIEPGHLGEIAYTARGSRYSASARCEGDEPIERNATVTIARIDGSVFVVAAERA